MKNLFNNKLLGRIHVLVKLMALICFAVMSHKFDDILLVLCLVLLSMLLVVKGVPRPFKMLNRTRWLMLTLLFVYAFNIPGEYVFTWSSSILQISPSYEGLHAGLSQALKLSVVILALSLLLLSTTRELLIGGLYIICKSLLRLGFLGIKHHLINQVPERFAVRLWLTLHYVETDRQLFNAKLYSSLSAKPSLAIEFKRYFYAFDHVDINQYNDLEYIHMQVDTVTWFDKCLFGILFLILVCSVIY